MGVSRPLRKAGGEISSLGPTGGMDETIHITIPGNPDDPRFGMEAPPGIVIHRSPPLHPDDLDVVRGIPVTSLARTLVDLAEVSDKDELRSYFMEARAQGRLDISAVRAS